MEISQEFSAPEQRSEDRPGDVSVCTETGLARTTRQFILTYEFLGETSRPNRYEQLAKIYGKF